MKTIWYVNPDHDCNDSQGAPQSILAHPDMRGQVFEDFRRTTSEGNLSNKIEAHELAVTTSVIAAQGRRAFGEVIRTIGSIKDSSRRMVDITAVKMT